MDSAEIFSLCLVGLIGIWLIIGVVYKAISCFCPAPQTRDREEVLPLRNIGDHHPGFIKPAKPPFHDPRESLNITWKGVSSDIGFVESLLLLNPLSISQNSINSSSQNSDVKSQTPLQREISTFPYANESSDEEESQTTSNIQHATAGPAFPDQEELDRVTVL